VRGTLGTVDQIRRSAEQKQIEMRQFSISADTERAQNPVGCPGGTR
jgi:hypothetical protein